MATVDRVRAVLGRLLETGVVVGAADGRPRKLFPVAIGPVEGQALADWVRGENARRTLEVGLGFGLSTLFICEALLENGPDGRHVVTDPYQHRGLPSRRTSFAGMGLQVLEEAGVRELVEFYPEESQIVLPRLLAEGRRFDLAFLDGNHRFEGVFLDLVYCARLLPEGGIVFVDDTQLPAVRQAVAFCTANLGWAIVDGGKERRHQWLVFRTGPSAAFDRRFDRHTLF